MLGEKLSKNKKSLKRRKISKRGLFRMSLEENMRRHNRRRLKDVQRSEKKQVLLQKVAQKDLLDLVEKAVLSILIM